MVSVILCTYNREKTICEAVDSILAQTYRDFELLIVDDGSTDGTRALLEEYRDERMKCIYLPENSYYCYAANIGIEQVSGKYVAFATSDDVWMPEKLEKQVRYLEEHPKCGAVFSKVALIGKEGERVEKEYPEIMKMFEQDNRSRTEWMHRFLEEGNCLSHPASIVRKSILDNIGGYNLLYAQLADFDLWVRIVIESEIYIHPERLVKYRWYSEKGQISGLTEEKWMRMVHEFTMIKRNLLENLEDEKFKEFFQEMFRNPESSTHVELEFERAFLMMEKGIDFTRINLLGFQKIEEALRIPGAMKVLKKHFGMRIQDLYKQNGQKWYLDVSKEQLQNLEEQLEYLEEEKRNLQIAIVQCEKEYNGILQSTCWKITKPLRAVLDIIKGK